MLLKNTAIFSIGEFAARGGKLLAIYVVALLMSKVEFGAYAFILSLALVFVTFFDFGENSLVVLRVIKVRFRYLLPLFYVAKFTTTLVVSLLAIIAYLIIGRVGGISLNVLPAIIALCITWDLQTFLANAQRARLDFSGEMWSKLIANFGFFLILGAAALVSRQLNITEVLLIQAAALFAGAAFSFWRMRPHLQSILPHWRHARRGVLAILRIGAPLTLAASVGVLQASIDSLVLGAFSFLSTNASFTIAQRMGQMTYLPLGILVSVALPYLTERLRGEQKSVNAAFLNETLFNLVVASTLVAQIFALVGEWIIPRALGYRYADVGRYSDVLALYMIPIYLFPVLSTLLCVMRSVLASQAISGVATIVSLGLDILAIRTLGPFAVVWVAVAVNWVILGAFVGLYRVRAGAWPMRTTTVTAMLIGAASIALPRLIWPESTLQETSARVVFVLVAALLLTSTTWRRWDFLKRLATHRGAA